MCFSFNYLKDFSMQIFEQMLSFVIGRSSSITANLKIFQASCNVHFLICASRVVYPIIHGHVPIVFCPFESLMYLYTSRSKVTSEHKKSPINSTVFFFLNTKPV